MEIEKLISKLMVLMTIHGCKTRVMVNHSECAVPYLIDAEDGCPEYISIESE